MDTMKLVDDLQNIANTARPSGLNMGAKTVYLGAGWFSDQQEAELRAVAKALFENPTVADVHIPLLHQANGTPYDEAGEFNPDFEWGYATYNTDITAIQNTDVVLTLLTAGNEDSGTAFEMGYATALGKPRLGVFRGDINAKPLNLMTAFGVSSYVENIADLRTIDFRHIMAKPYAGKVI